MKDQYIYIYENLTSFRKLLVFETKKLKKVLGYEFVWTKMGEIYARKNVIKISRLADLKLMCYDHIISLISL